MTRNLASRLCLAILITALLAASVGCGRDTVKVVPAAGVVKIGGKPAANVMVQFMPDARKGGKGPTSSATTDADGNFKLMAQDGRDGAVVGTHLVVLIDPDEERPAQGQPLKHAPRLDSKYAAPTLSNLTAEVADGGGPIVVDVPAPR